MLAVWLMSSGYGLLFLEKILLETNKFCLNFGKLEFKNYTRARAREHTRLHEIVFSKRYNYGRKFKIRRFERILTCKKILN